MFVTMFVTMLHLREQEMFNGFCDPISRGGASANRMDPGVPCANFSLLI